MTGAHFATALNKRMDSVFLWLWLALVDVLFLAADIGLVALDNEIATADWAAFGFRRRHGLTNTHLKKPCTLVLKAKHPAELMRAHSFLARGHQAEGEKPLTQGNVASLHDSARADREPLPALAAMVEAMNWLGDRVFLRRLAHHWRGLHGVLLLTEWARSAARPALSFKMLASRVVVVKDRIGDIKHGFIPRLISI
jgi:hypothetical protein